jgi:hypothetical protein
MYGIHHPTTWHREPTRIHAGADSHRGNRFERRANDDTSLHNAQNDVEPGLRVARQLGVPTRQVDPFVNLEIG